MVGARVLNALLVARVLLRRWQTAPALGAGPVASGPSPVAMSVPPVEADAEAGTESSFEQGVREIRQTDRGFDPTRFTGYAAMLFRDAQGAWMTDDIAALRTRVTPEIYEELEAERERLRTLGRANCIEQVEIEADVTEVWQEGGRDYVTAHIGGSIVDYTVEARDRVVGGSRTTPRDVEEFWTFTRPSGFNFWMLSAIQTS